MHALMARPSRLSESRHGKIPTGKEEAAMRPLKRLPRKQPRTPLPGIPLSSQNLGQRQSQADVGRGSRASSELTLSFGAVQEL